MNGGIRCELGHLRDLQIVHEQLPLDFVEALDGPQVVHVRDVLDGAEEEHPQRDLQRRVGEADEALPS